MSGEKKPRGRPRKDGLPAGTFTTEEERAERRRKYEGRFEVEGIGCEELRGTREAADELEQAEEATKDFRKKGAPKKKGLSEAEIERRKALAGKLVKARQEIQRRREIARKELPPWKVDYASKEEFDRQYAIAKWWNNLCETNNETFLPLFFCESRYLVLMGGAGSGKSIFAGRKLIERAVTEKNHRILVTRKVARTLRDSCFKQLCSQLSQYYPKVKWTSNKSDLVISIEDTGSEFIFAGLDDTEKLKSIYGITLVWIEEASEIEEADFAELDRRMRGETEYYKQIIISFNPISVTHWLKRRFFDRSSPDVTTHKSTYLDNRFLPAEDRKVLEEFKYTDPYQYSVYCLGEWGVTGKTVFDGEKVQHQLDLDISPVMTGEFIYRYDGLSVTDIEFEERPGGVCLIYEKPVEGVPYVIGGDTAGEGCDDFVAQVIDNRDGHQVATLRHKYDEDQYARQVYCLGMYYNTALVGIETNFSTHPVKELERLRYPKQYIRDVPDDFRGRITHSFGFRTDRATRPNLVAILVKEVRDHPENFVDRETLLQMITFVRNDRNRAEAAEGAHDDCVMAIGIAHSIRGQQSREGAEKTDTLHVKWTKDMYEDYQNAGEAERRMLINRWGNPF